MGKKEERISKSLWGWDKKPLQNGRGWVTGASGIRFMRLRESVLLLRKRIMLQLENPNWLHPVQRPKSSFRGPQRNIRNTVKQYSNMLRESWRSCNHSFMFWLYRRAVIAFTLKDGSIKKPWKLRGPMKYVSGFYQKHHWKATDKF